MGQINGWCISRMQKGLHLYSLDYHPAYPVWCFDQRPCFLIGDKIAPLPIKAGRVKKAHEAYEQNGSCGLLMAIAPLRAKQEVWATQKNRVH